MRPFRLFDASLRFVERWLWGDRPHEPEVSHAQDGPMISYAQNGEDVLLARAFKGQTRGFYIDVGANDPVADSVTKFFYDRGFCGINIEPGRVFDKLTLARSRDINLQIALSDREGECTFYEFPDCDGLSTLSAYVPAHQNLPCVERTAVVATLAGVCEKYVQGTIDFLKIDVEGHEPEVIAGGDWRRWRPRIVVVESPTLDDGDGPHLQWEPRLLEADYLFAASDGLNRYYVRREDERLLGCFRRPPNVLDNYVPYRFIQPVQATQPKGNLGPLALSAARWLQKVIDVAGFWYPRQLTNKGTF
ncbi:MAG TPA: FkbM family methyltransferase [Pirellulales bacterium]|nr:FkbM family methyltransferase [Pirellulales bacterium]